MDDALDRARGRLIKALPWLSVAFCRLRGEVKPGAVLPGTDGTRFFYSPECPERDAAFLASSLAHSTMHCLLGHLRARPLDALAADMAATLLMDELLPAFCPAHGSELFMQARHRLSDIPLGGIAAAMDEDEFFSRHRDVLLDLIALDDHRFWKPEAVPIRITGESGDGWDDLSRLLRGRMRQGRFGLTAGNEIRRYQGRQPVNRSYRDLMARYAEYHEEAREDLDSYDRNLYAYGLELYGNLPIVEPAETRERRHIDELAIVIDTSGSCLETLTARFLDETRALLADETLFASRFNLRILQCDAQVRRDDHITCLRDFERYIDGLEIVGGGGTDFRPAFQRIDRLIERGAFRRLKAALFFSDGLGLFPTGPGDYDTIFVFFRGQYDDIDVPAWAQKLVLED